MKPLKVTLYWLKVLTFDCMVKKNMLTCRNENTIIYKNISTLYKI